MANLLSLSLSFLLLFHGCLALRRSFQQQQQNECQFQRINALEAKQRVQAEAGWTEFFDANNQQFQCAGAEVMRHRIQPQGLLLPSYLNAPIMVYIQQGRGYQGIMMPGCPETFQSSQQMQERGQQSFQDRHQKIREFRQGDVIVIPAGAAHWMYNDGNEDIIAIVMLDNTNALNQLDQYHRRFFLAGNPNEPEQQDQKGGESEEEGSANIFRGFRLEILMEAFNVDRQTAEKLQSPSDNRGHIVKVERGLQVVRPPSTRQQEQDNGLEETICTHQITLNIDEPSRADFYNPQAGRCTNLNSFKLPILEWVQLSAERGVLHKNAMVSPYYVMNAHSLVYVTHGNMRMQIVSNEGEAVFDETIEEGQLVVVPQNFAVVKQAGNEGCGWIAFRTNDNAMVNTLAGYTSAMRGMPVEVLANAYQMSREEASELKSNRKESVMFMPSSEWSRRA